MAKQCVNEIRFAEAEDAVIAADKVIDWILENESEFCGRIDWQRSLDAARHIHGTALSAQDRAGDALE